MQKYIILTLLTFSFLLGEEADHIIFTRITITPDEAEMIAIYNPTNGTINLSDYYLSDAEYSAINKHYYNLPAGNDYWSGFSSDFIGRFPDININSQQTLTISLHEVSSFNSYYSYNPDLTLTDDMLDAIDGQNTIGPSSDLLNNSYEVLILFKWDGNPASLIQDVDYFYWGDPQGLTFYGVDKTGVLTYEDDTPFNIQADNILGAHDADYAYRRKSTTEDGESGPSNNVTGNGITEHDETSEVFIDSWEILNDFGCTNPDALNYNPDAIIDDGNCEYAPNDDLGCTDPEAPNYNPDATIDDGSCLVVTEIPDIINNCSFDSGDTIECDGQYELAPDSATECPFYEQTITTTGIVVDYFDITPYDGPHSFTIRDTEGNQIDFVVWPESSSYQDGFDITQTDLSILTDPGNFGLYEVSITGELGVYCDDDEELDIYTEWQITVEYEEDIIIINDSEDSSHTDENVIKPSIDPAPFVLIPTLGERLQYTFSFPPDSKVVVRIFDFNGNIVMSLYEEYPPLGDNVYEKYWDGKDHLGQIVIPGTYFMHIQTTNIKTGQADFDMAPIVVGVY